MEFVGRKSSSQSLSTFASLFGFFPTISLSRRLNLDVPLKYSAPGERKCESVV